MYFKQFQKNDYARLAMVNGAILAHHTGLGKSWAAYTWPLLKVGYTKSIQNGRTVLTPNAPILIVSPGDLHQQLIGEGERHFKVHTVRLDSKETFLRLSTLDAVGRRQLPPGFFLTSYTQLGVNGVAKMPDPDTTPTAILLDSLGWKMDLIAKAHDALRMKQERLDGGPNENTPIPWTRLSAAEQDRFTRLRYRQALVHYVDTVGETRTVGSAEVKCIYSPSLADLCQDCFACVVVDEATKMKGKDTLVALGVRQLTPKYRLVMTATPIKNRLPDVFWLLWWACGGQCEAQARFPYSPEDQDEFAKTFSVSERNFTQEAKTEKKRRFVKLTPQVCNIHRFWKLMAPNVLRRLKKDIGEQLVGKQHHVYRVPMGRRQAEVGDGGDVLGGHGALAGHYGILFLGDVELVEPAEDLDIGPLTVAAVLVADLGAEALDDGVLGEEVIGQEQLGLVVEFLEEVRQQRVVETAGGEDEVAIDLPLRIRRRDATIEEIIEPGGIGVGLQFLGQGSGAGEFEQLRLRLRSAGRREDAGAERMPAAGVHEAERGEAVEPGVGDALYEANPICLRELPQRSHLRSEGREQVGRLGRECKVELARDGLHELFSDGGGEGLEGGGVHGNYEL